MDTDRTQKLQDLLRFRLDRQNAELLSKFLAAIATVEILGWVDDGEDWNGLAEKLNEITKISSNPLNQLALDRISTDFLTWLQSVMSCCNLASPVYLQVSEFYCSRWVQIHSNDLTKAVATILENLGFREIVIVDCTSKSVLAFFMEEYDIEAHYRQ